MSEQDFLNVFSKRLRYYLDENSMTQRELASHLNVGTTSVYNWVNGIKSPRMDKVDSMCKLFGCMRSDLLEEKGAQQRNFIDLSKLERSIVIAYRKADEIDKEMVNRILKIN